MLKTTLKIFIILLLPIFAFAGDNEQENGFQILKVGIGANEAGKGGAVSATSGNASILWYNPASVQLSPYSNFCFSRINYNIFDVNIDNASIIFRQGKSSFGFGLTFLNYGIIDKTDEQGTIIGEFHPTDIIAAGNYSCRISPSLYLGSNLKLAFEKIDTETAFGFGTDFGVIWDTYLKNLNLSTVMQNLGFSTKLKNESIHLPLTFKCGANYRFKISNQNNLSLSSDIIYYKDEDTKCNFGLAYVYADKIFTRFGYKLNYDAENISAGLGLKINAYKFDYSFTPYSDELGNVHRISLSYSF